MSETKSKLRFLHLIPGVFVMLVIVGVIWPQKEIWGAVLAAFASILVWLLTYLHSEFQQREQAQRFRAAIWTEMNVLGNALTREAEWWEARLSVINAELAKAQPQQKWTVTQKRLLTNHQAAVLSANLDRITDFNSKTADVLIVLLARLRGLLEQQKAFYEAEDLMIQNRVDTNAFIKNQKNNTGLLFEALVNAAVCAFNAAKFMDDGKSFLHQHVESTPVELLVDQAETRLKLKLWREKYGMAG
jgi:hypothetical protein